MFDLGFTNFKRKWRFSKIKDIIGRTAHIEGAKGTDEQNRVYCTKGDNVWEFGEPIRQGERSDLKRVVATIETATSLRDVITGHPQEFIRYHRGIEKLFHAIAPKQRRSWNTQVTVFYGESGAGKSRACAELAPEAYYKTHGEWWDNYTGQEAVILDDFYGWLRLDEFLRVGDRYPLQVPVKGGFVEFIAKRLLITSNKEPLEWYSKDKLSGHLKEAFLRRLDKIYYCTKLFFEKIK